MKLIYSTLTLLIIISANAQKFEGVVKDSLSKKTLDFVNVYYTNKGNYGTFTDSLGFFNLDILNISDSICFSRIGYESKKHTVSDILNKKINTFFLSEKTQYLNEIVILNKKIEFTSVKKIKQNKSKENNYFSFQFGTEHCVYIPNNENANGILESLILDLKQVKNGTKECEKCVVDYITDFNLKFYEYDENTQKPGKEIYNKPILVEPQNKTYLLKIKLEDYKIKLPKNGICIGIEVINTKYKSPKTSGAISAPSIDFERVRKKNNFESWVRYRNIGNWTFKSNVGKDKSGYFFDKINLDLKVKYEKK